MGKYFLTAVLTLLLLAAGPAVAATPVDFHLNLLRRGVAEYDAGRHETAAMYLRLAAFGLIDSTEHYQTAQVYLTLVSDRLQEDDAARDAALRVVNAERIRKTYLALQLPASIRTAFDTAAKKLLPASDVAFLATAPSPVPRQLEPEKKPVEVRAQPASTQSGTNGAATAAPQSKEPPKETAPPVKKQQAAAPPQQQTPPRTTNPQNSTARRDVNAELAAADRALEASKLAEAQKLYRALLQLPLSHESYLRAAEGLYRARDFAGALLAFEKVGTLAKGEEVYRYYRAVALYETKQYAAAKKELSAALPYIQVTPDVAAYRTKIESAK